MTINTNGDSTDTYGNLFSDPKLIPSDSTIVYGWELDENGLLTFFSDPSQQYFNNIGNVEYGWVQLYSHSYDLWSPSYALQPEFLPLIQSVEFERLHPIPNENQNEPNRNNIEFLQLIDHSDIKKRKEDPIL